MYDVFKTSITYKRNLYETILSLSKSITIRVSETSLDYNL